MLLPEIKHTTVFPLITSLNLSKADIAKAPAGSTNIPSSLNNFIIVVQTCPSGIRYTSLSTEFKISNGFYPDFLIAAPSTNVLIVSSSTTCYYFNASNIDGDLLNKILYPSGSTPIIIDWGETYLKYDEIPAPHPPPPTGKKKKSTLLSGISSKTSTAIVPYPSIIFSSSNAWT